MVKSKPAPVSDAREYFSDELRSALGKQQVKAQSDSIEYLVNLLVNFIQSENFFSHSEDGKLRNPVLADLYAEIVQGDPATRLAALRRLGDVCLMVTGMFPDSLNRKLVDIDYYFGMGGTAYAELSKLQFSKMSRSVYQELAEKFKPFSDVLGEMSSRSGIQTNGDILRLYEKWLLTKSERLRGLLSEHGIAAPIVVDWNTKQ